MVGPKAHLCESGKQLLKTAGALPGLIFPAETIVVLEQVLPCSLQNCPA